jgi:hypothetical protein
MQSVTMTEIPYQERLALLAIRIEELEQENAQLREGRCPDDGHDWDEHFDLGYAAGLADGAQYARGDDD